MVRTRLALTGPLLALVVACGHVTSLGEEKAAAGGVGGAGHDAASDSSSSGGSSAGSGNGGMGGAGDADTDADASALDGSDADAGSRSDLILVSVSSEGVLSDQMSPHSAISADGRYVAFTSTSTLLTSEATAGAFVHDRVTGSTVMVSVSSTGVAGDATVSEVAISGDGRYVAFVCNAINLVAGGDTNNKDDVFVRDLQAGTTVRASTDASGAQMNSAGAGCGGASISADGHFVGMLCGGSNLVPNDTNFVKDIFVKDLQTGAIERINVTPTGAQTSDPWASKGAVRLSHDGRYVAFSSAEPDLVAGDTNGDVDVFVRDRTNGMTERVSVANDGSESPSTVGAELDISSDGRFVVFSTAAALVPADSNGGFDVYVRDRTAATTEQITVGLGGTQPNPWSGGLSISGDGRFVSFDCDYTSKPVTSDVGFCFVRDRTAGITIPVGRDGTCIGPHLSSDATFVSFQTRDPLLAIDTNGKADIYESPRP